MKSYRVATWMFLGVQELVLVPAMVLLWLRLYKRRNCHISRKRRVFWVLLWNFLLIFHIGASMPLRLLSNLDKGWRDSQKQLFFVQTAYATLLTMAEWMDLFRTWMLFYDLKLSRALTKLKWAALIDSSLAPAVSRYSLVQRSTLSLSAAMTSEDPLVASSQLDTVEKLPTVEKSAKDSSFENWYLSHWHNFGNARFCSSLMTLAGALPQGVLIMASFFLTVGGVLSHDVNSGIVLLLFTGLRLANVALYCKTPAANDTIFLREELRHLAEIHFGGIVSTFVAIIAVSAFKLSFVTRTLLLTIVLDLIIVGQFSFLVYWCVDKMESEGLLADYYENDTRIRAQSGSSTVSAARRRRSSSAKTAPVRQIICDNDGFQLFMTHLVHEFSAECLLSVVEFVQFKQLVTRHLADGTCAEMHSAVATESQSASKCPTKIWGLSFDSFQFPRCVPMSTIVSAAHCGDDAAIDSNKVAVAICALFDKYMTSESAMQINVRYETQVEMESFIANTLERTALADDSEWLHSASHAFDDIISENIRLMSFAAARFAKTKEYNLWQQ